MAITIHDVARRARVSVATVSRALAEPRLLRERTLRRVLAAAEQLAYRPNPAARSLITGRTGNIGIIVPDLDNPFYPSVLRGAQARAHQAGNAVLLADSHENAGAEVSLVHTMAKQVDGVIICAPFATDAQLKKLAAGVPLVLVNRRCGDIPAALMEIAHGMREVVQHLHGLGHRRCVYLAGPASAWSNRERLRGLRAAARSTKMTLLESGPFEPKFESGIAAADEALESGATAIVAYNDLMALGVLSRLATRGVRVPQQMSVVGFDDLLFAAMCAPPLTTVAMPMEAAGHAAVDLLLARLAGTQPANARQQLRLPTQLCLRATTAAPFTRPARSRRSGPR